MAGEAVIARPLLLDASAITAFIRREEGGQVVLDTITSGGGGRRRCWPCR